MAAPRAKRLAYLGQCDRLRRGAPEGEARWQRMMAGRRPITFERFARLADLRPLLDEGETPEGWLAELRRADPSARAYASRWDGRPAAFVQTAGFEFIFAAREGAAARSDGGGARKPVRMRSNPGKGYGPAADAVYDGALAAERRVRQTRKIVENYAGAVPGAPNLDGPSAVVLLSAHALGDFLRALVAGLRALRAQAGSSDRISLNTPGDMARRAWRDARRLEALGREMATLDSRAFRRTHRTDQFEIDRDRALAALDAAAEALAEAREMIDETSGEGGVGPAEPMATLIGDAVSRVAYVLGGDLLKRALGLPAAGEAARDGWYEAGRSTDGLLWWSARYLRGIGR